MISQLGTNDATQNFEVSTAQDRLGAILDRIIIALPGTVVLISNLIPNLDAAGEANIKIINAALPAMVQARTDAGALVYLADMHTAITNADINSGGTHPTDAGYIKMANVWYASIQQIYANCWFTPPGDVPGLNDTVGAGVKDVSFLLYVGLESPGATHKVEVISSSEAT